MTEQLAHFGTDIDDTLVGSAELVAELINKKYGTRLSSEDWYQPHDPSAWGVQDQRVAWGRVNDALHSDEFIEKSVTLEGSVQFLRSVKLADHALSACTGRPDTPGNRGMTHELLKVRFSGLFSSERMYFTDHFGQSGKRGSKVDIAIAQSLTHMADDHLDHVNPLAEAGIVTYLVGDYPWNQGEAHPLVVRAPHWRMIEEHYFNDVEQRNLRVASSQG